MEEERCKVGVRWVEEGVEVALLFGREFLPLFDPCRQQFLEETPKVHHRYVVQDFPRFLLPNGQ